ncbi:YheT family hydrolase [Pedobacter glucosidilyticus]|uniref:YheT family hydrolase n=1 Tax=Pedobacter glucosidilyticus TaxID=1122941 RepID=UPI0003FEC61F|nr:alpha/beta fold hydrolase [Pedobacter glucosidilyticus]
MPIIKSKYRPPFYLFSAHLQTIVPAISFKINHKLYTTEKLETSDGDFIELDWIKGSQEKLMILCHGVEGNSRSHYVQQMAIHFSKLGWTILAIHARSCGREMNRLPQAYYGGFTNDIETVILKYAESYPSMVLVGFSLGGNMVLNFAGRHHAPHSLKAVIGFSVPCELRSSERKLDGLYNRIYSVKILKKLKNKIRKLEANHPGAYDLEKLDKITSLQEFSVYFTAPFFGFKSLDDFYKASSCLDALSNIKIPTLLVNAKNDPLLTNGCFPVEIAKQADHLFLEMPKRGGHSAFPISKAESWMPLRVEEFLKEVNSKVC